MREQKRYEIFLKVCETGSFSSITTLWIPEVVHYFKENYPKVKIEILDGNYDEIRGVISCTGRSFVYCLLFTDRFKTPGGLCQR